MRVLIGRVAQELKVQAGRAELWQCRDSATQASIRCPGREKKRVGGSRPIADAFAVRDRTREWKKYEEKKGEGRVAQVLLLTCIVVVRSVPGSRRPPAPVVAALSPTC